MIEEIRCETWEVFKKELGNLECEREKKKEESRETVHPWLYRDQADCKRKLLTTLERKSCKQWNLPEYGILILSIYSKIEKSTGGNFKLPTPEEYRKWVHRRNGMPYFKDPNDEYGTTGSTTRDYLKYLIYLRHHGFPSSLLDWTECPYIAAYFAFKHDKQPDAEHAAIFAYLGWAGCSRTSASSESSIEPIGTTVIAHKRHSVQQSWYTVAFQKHYSRTLAGRVVAGRAQAANRALNQLVQPSLRTSGTPCVNQLALNIDPLSACNVDPFGDARRRSYR